MSAIEENKQNKDAPALNLFASPQQSQACSPRRTLRQTVGQQQILINVLREQITRMQYEAIEKQKKFQTLQKQHNDALQLIQTQKQKIQSLRQNNQSIMHTFEVFQRQFVKRDYKNPMTAQPETQKASDGPFFIQLIRNMKDKFSQPIHTQIIRQEELQQNSQINEYYGYFLNQEIDEKQTQLYNQLQDKTIMGHALRNPLKSYGKKHYFNEKYRHWFWYHIMDNWLRISRPLYELYSQKISTLKTVKQDQGNVSLIDRDLNRMDFKLDEQKSKTMIIAIRKCLETFEVYRPDIGYVQGMSYLAWMFLVRLDEYRAFSCFANLILCDPFVHSLYFFKERSIQKIKQFYEKCMEDKKGKLQKHMKSLQVQCQFFIIQWAYTMFTRAFNLRISSKIWDLWFSQGYGVFFKTVLVIMDILQDQIMKIHENDKIIEFIRTQTHKIDEIELLKGLKKQKLPQQLGL